MKSQLNVMRRLAAVFGVALFLTQLDSSTTPAQAFMDPIGQSKTNDPDYHLKVAARILWQVNCRSNGNGGFEWQARHSILD